MIASKTSRYQTSCTRDSKMRSPKRLPALLSFCMAFTTLFINKMHVATATSSTPTSSTSCTTEWIGDGFCDLSNDSDDCDYDGGDCCSCTCTDGTYECGAAGFFCVDPGASCYPSCDFSEYGDGSCTAANNVLDCNYDGGDCCPCTCVDDTYECGANGYDCQDLSAGCTTSTSTSGTTTSSSCTTEWIGDGFCDLSNNSDDCDYDGGDCCSCTCTDGTYECGAVGFFCVDLGASCYPSCDFSEYGDGSCTAANNVLDCNYDGGDCCSCTCVDDTYECGANGYDCQDLSAGCTTSTSTSGTTTSSSCTTEWIGDGFCNLSNNSDDCDYDGGDCCSCTCTDGTYECGAAGFFCVDLGASCYPSCDFSEYGDGSCTAANNVLDCNYDGGDCCPCTCVDDTYECGANGYDCQDLSAGCTTSTSTSGTTTSSSCTTEWIGDGFCDLSNNSDDCDYDGGDCCSCTCTDGTYECGAAGFFCVDLGASCYPSCDFSEYGDGSCTAANNVLDCNYDGGDCCPCTCVDDTYECGANGYDCQDLSAGCTTSTSTSGTTTSSSCTTEWIGDGFCNLSNNSDDCDYDGGDCCPCTCVDDTYECGANGYDCQDPSARCTTSTSLSDRTPQPTPIPTMLSTPEETRSSRESESTPTSDGDGDSVSVAMIGGIAGAGVLALAATVACVYFYRKSRGVQPTPDPKPRSTSTVEQPPQGGVVDVQHTSGPSAPPLPEGFTARPPQPIPSYNHLYGGQGSVS